MKMKKRFAAAAAALPLAAAFLLAAPAHADSQTDELIQSLEGYWTEYGVADAVQADLVAGIENGRLPDSITGASEPTVTVDTSSTGSLTIQTYADGSIATSSVELPDPNTAGTAREIRDCTITSGSGFSTASGCTIAGSNGQVQITFKAGYTLVQGTYDYLQDSGTDGNAPCVIYTCTSPTVSNYIERETAAAAGIVTYRTDWTFAASASGTAFLSLLVANDSAYSEFNSGT